MGERRRQAEGGRRRLGGAKPMGDLGAQDQGGGSAAEEHAGGAEETHLGLSENVGLILEGCLEITQGY